MRRRALYVAALMTVTASMAWAANTFTYESTALTSGQIPVADSTADGKLKASSCTDNGTTVTCTEKVVTPASATGAASLNMPHGSAPSSPVNGDLWTTTAGLFARINGSTVGPYGTGGASAPTVRSVSGTTDTLLAGDCQNIVLYTSASAVTVTVPATLVAGCGIAIVQDGAGQVSLTGTAVPAATLHNRQGFTKAAGQYSTIGVIITTNTGTADGMITGDGA